jgi:hypothetical protein
MIIGVYDDFRHKEVLVRLFEESVEEDEIQDKNVKSVVILTLRMMMIESGDYEDMRYIEYLGSIKHEDMGQWTDEEIEFYNRRGFPIEIDNMREEIWEAMKSEMDEGIHKDVRSMFQSEFKVFNHWYSVVQSRSQFIDYGVYQLYQENEKYLE